MSQDIYGAITDKIVAALEQGTVPWKRPWKLTGGFPISLSTGKPYRGINPLLLMLEGYDDPRWGTFKVVKETAAAHAKSEGRDIVVEKSKRGEQYFEILADGSRIWFDGGVRKGERSTKIVFWKKVERKDPKEGQDEKYMMLRYFDVFNAKQCNGLPELPQEEVREFTPIEEAERIVRGYIWSDDRDEHEPIAGDGCNIGPPVFHGYDHAAYSPTRDRVEMPDPEKFFSDEGYYCSLFHELVHSTGSEKRLKRIEPALFGTDPYAKEELVAEIGASFLAGIAGFETAGGEQSAAYLANWLEKLKNDRKLVVGAAAQAQKACDLIRDTHFEEEAKPEAQQEELIAA